MSKLIQRTRQAAYCSVELQLDALIWRSTSRQHWTISRSGAATNSTVLSAGGVAVGVPASIGCVTEDRDMCKRFYSKYPTPRYYPTARLGTAPPLSEEKAYALVVALNDTERGFLKNAMEKYEAEQMRKSLEEEETARIEYRNYPKHKLHKDDTLSTKFMKLWNQYCRLALAQWRTRFGRPSQVPPMSAVDPSGAFCTFPEDWFKRKAEEKAVPPTKSDLYKLFFTNAVPFVAFGFLDNFCMITAGDYLEDLLGTFMCISTMAAAGLGNTVSDLVGIGTSFYVERVCTLMGLRPPDLSQVQLELKQSRRASNLGRVMGIVVGCLLGMFPLLFLKDEDKEIHKRHKEK